jgi:DNA uptake protein ComE-like DNA-binding protein
MTRDYSKDDWLWNARGRHFQGDDPDDPEGIEYDRTQGARHHFAPEEGESVTAFEAALDRATAPSSSVSETELDMELDLRERDLMREHERQKTAADRWATFLDVGVYSGRGQSTRLQQPAATPTESYQTEDPTAFLQRGNLSRAGRILKRNRSVVPPSSIRVRGLTPEQVQAEAERQSGILSGFRQNVRSADPNARVGAHVHRKVPYDPSAQPGTQGYEQMLGAFMGWGLTRQELSQRLAGANLAGANAGQAASYLKENLGAEFGGMPPVDYRPVEGGLGVVATMKGPSHWKYLPAAKQIRYRTGLTGPDLGIEGSVEGMDPEDWPEGYVTRQGASRLWPSRVYTDLWAGPHKGESILSPYDPSDRSRLIKIAKRTQLQGVYKMFDYYSETGENITAQSPLRLGSTAMRRNRGVITNQMISLGEWLPEGIEMQPQGWIGSVRRAHTYDIPLPEGMEPKVVKRGTEWTGDSGKLELFEGAAPLKIGLGRNWDWAKLKDYSVVNARYYNERKGEYEDRRVLRAVMEQGASPETARLSSKTFWSKFMSGVGSPSAFHGEKGYGMTQIKEPTQLAYSYWMAHPNEMLSTLRRRGYDDLTMEGMKQKTWKDVSEPLYNAFVEEKLRPESEGGLYTEKPVTIPSVHKSQLWQFPEDTFDRTEIGEGYYRLESKKPMGFLKGKFFQMYRRGWALREPAHLPFREVQRLERVAKERFAEHPGVAEYFSEIRKQGYDLKQAYSGIIKASISGGPHGYPKNAIAPDPKAVQEAVAAGRAMSLGEEGEEPTEAVLARAVMQQAAQTKWGQKPLLTEEGVLAAPAHALRFMASGSLSTEEATAYGQLYGKALLGLSEKVGSKARREALQGALGAQSKLAESRKFLRRALGTPIPKAFGGPALSSSALASTEITAPVERVMRAYGMDPSQRHIEGTREYKFEHRWKQGMKLGSIVMGQPMPGDWPLSRMFNVIHPEVAKERGMQLSEGTGLVINPKLAEALGRDFDEDLFWNLMMGEVDPEGRLKLPGQQTPGGEPGIPWATEGFVAKQAQTAVEEMQRQDLSRGHKFRNLEELRAAMDPRNLHELDAETVGSAMAWTNKLRQYIGPTYASLEDVEHVARSMGLGEEAEKFFGVIHGQTQTPKELPPELQKVVGMLNSLSLHKGGASYFDKLLGGPGGQGDFSNLNVSAGPAGIQEAFMPALMSAKHLSPKLVAKLGFPRRNWGEAEELVKRWRSAEDDFERAKLARQRARLTGEWETETPIGLTATAMALGRGQEDVVNEIVSNLDPYQRKLFNTIRSRAKAWRSSLSKRADADPLAARVQAGMDAAPGLFGEILGQMGMPEEDVERMMSGSSVSLGGTGTGGEVTSRSIGGWSQGDPREQAMQRTVMLSRMAKQKGYDSVQAFMESGEAPLPSEPIAGGAGSQGPPRRTTGAPPAAPPPPPGGPPGSPPDEGPSVPQGMAKLGQDLKDTMEWAFGVSKSKFKTAVEGLEMYGPQFLEASQAITQDKGEVTPGYRQMANQMATWLGHAQKGATRFGESNNQEMQQYVTTAKTYMEGELGSAIPMMAATAQADLMQQRFESVVPPEPELTTTGFGFLNTATAEQLQQVKGVGSKLAGRIVKRRREIARLPGASGFATKKGVTSVHGIGQTSLAQMIPAIEEAGVGVAEDGVVDNTKLLNKRMRTLADHLEDWGKQVGPAVKNTQELSDAQKQWTERLAREVQSVTGSALEQAQETGDVGLATAAMRLKGSDAYRQMIQASEDDWARSLEGAAPSGGIGEWFKTSFFGAEGPMKGVDRVMGQLTSGWRLMMMRRLWGMTGGVAMGNIPVAAESAQTMMGAAAATMPVSAAPVSGIGMGLMEAQAQKKAGQVAMGRAAYRAYGDIQQFLTTQTGGAAAGVGLPALGTGAVAGTLATMLGGSFTGVGLPVALAAGGYGLYSYIKSMRGDQEQMALNLAQGKRGVATEKYYRQPQVAGTREDRGWFYNLTHMSATAGGMGGIGGAIMADVPTEVGRGTPNDPRVAMMQDPNVLGLTPEGTRLYYKGRRLKAGRFQGMTAAERAASIQYAAKTYRPEGVTAERAAEMIGEYYEMTPGAVGQMTPREILESDVIQSGAITGRGPRWWSQQAGQMGYLGTDWQKAYSQMKGLEMAEVNRRMEIAGRWGAATRLGVGRTEIFEAAASGGLPVVSGTALNNAIGMIGQIAPTPGFGGMSISSWGSALRATQQRLTQARANGNYVGGWGMNTLWGLQDAMTAENTRYSQAQAGLQMERIAAQRRYLWGGGTPTAPGPDSLWGLQDVSRRFNYVQQMGGISPISGRAYTGAFNFSAQQANMSLAHTMASAGLSLRHTLESTGLSRRMYMARWGFQQEDMEDKFEDLERQRERAATVYGWKMQDWHQQFGRSAIEFGWRMEDYDENIRRATGYQRERLMRQRERDVVRRKWETTDLQEEKDRMEQRREWEEEDFERKKENLEELKERNQKLHELRLEQFDMREEHAKESHALRVSQAQESHALRMKQLEERKAAYQEEYEHQQKITTLQREHQAEQLEFQERQAGLSAAHAEAMRELQERYTNIQRSIATMATDFNNEIIDGLVELLQEAGAILDNYNTPSGLPPREGGLPY